ncbi:MAG TPA: YceI family protein [Vicinamibacteria bacterium]|nr:YceI family protein [Vicinamibacteria bacterium]
MRLPGPPAGLRSTGALVGVLAAATAGAGARTYVVDASASSVRIHVGRAGAFAFAGHEHDVAAPAVRGEVVALPGDLGASSVFLTFDAGALVVLPDREPKGDAPKVQSAMLGPGVLDVARFPSITFRSRRVVGRAAGPDAYDLEVEGEMTLRGVTRALTLPMRVELAGNVLTASGRAVLRQKDFGMKPPSVAGLVKVKNEIAVTYRIVARGR